MFLVCQIYILKKQASLLEAVLSADFSQEVKVVKIYLEKSMKIYSDPFLHDTKWRRGYLGKGSEVLWKEGT